MNPFSMSRERPSMTAVAELLGLSQASDPIAHGLSVSALEELQLEAARERLEEQRPLIPALDRRCTESGVDAIKSPADLVPLLFSHVTYKSYPASFIEKGQWDRLSLWLETVTAPKVSSVDLSGVTDIDGWLDRLKEHGLHLIASSGTTGKNSFLLMTDADVTAAQSVSLALNGFPNVIPQRNDRPIVLLVPGNGPMRYCYGFKAYTRAIARLGAAHTLTDEPMLVSDSIRAAALRKAMAEGSITPAELAEAGVDDSKRRVSMDAAIRRITDVVLGYRDEPQLVIGPWVTWWRLMEIAREQGVASIAGGLKGASLPDDYQEQMARFLGDVQRPKLYSMSECSTVSPMCEAGMYHVAPWMTLLMLDEGGEHLLEPGDDGWITGRVAFYDPLWQSRWGGVVSGDQAAASYTNRCDCGRPGPIMRDSIQRYSELSGAADDKLTCGGTIEQYIRGVVGT
jgi:hypothetical protein